MTAFSPIHGDLVHNARVVRQLDEAGFRQSAEDSRHAVVQTPLVLITAHGVSNAERQRLAAANKELIDTTCPLVRRAHDAAQELRAEGRHVLLVGKPGHVEVRGIVEDLESCHVIEKPGDVGTYDRRLLGIVSQTTMAPDVFAEVCANVRRLNPLADVRVIDTVCRPTKIRQRAVLDLARRVDAVVVVGGRNSNNTRWLVQVCREQGTPAVHVESAGELDARWFAEVRTVGLTAGTSTPDETIDAVHRALERIGSDSRSDSEVSDSIAGRQLGQPSAIPGQASGADHARKNPGVASGTMLYTLPGGLGGSDVEREQEVASLRPPCGARSDPARMLVESGVVAARPGERPRGALQPRRGDVRRH